MWHFQSRLEWDLKISVILIGDRVTDTIIAISLSFIIEGNAKFQFDFREYNNRNFP